MAGPRRNRITDLGELQLAVLDVLSRLGEATVQDVVDEFALEERPRYTTILTVLRSLEARGLVDHRDRERTYVFRPVVDSTQLRRRLLGDVLDRVFGGSPGDLVATLLQVEAVTPDVVRELRALLARREGEADEQ